MYKRQILEIGGQDSKIICVSDGIAVDYAMNTLCAAGTGSFLSSQAHRLGVEVEEFGDIALTSTKPANIAARCTVFAESDLVHKIQVGYAREDIIAGLCNAVASNYLNNVGLSLIHIFAVRLRLPRRAHRPEVQRQDVYKRQRLLSSVAATMVNAVGFYLVLTYLPRCV